MAVIQRSRSGSATSPHRRGVTIAVVLAGGLVAAACSSPAPAAGGSTGAPATSAASSSGTASSGAGSSGAASSGTAPLATASSKASATGSSVTSAASTTASAGTGSSTTASSSGTPDPSSSGRSSSSAVSLELPAPTGGSAVGTVLVHLRDSSRTDPLDPKGGKRQLMVQLWYPTDDTAGPLAPYAPAGEAAALQKFYPVPAGAFTAATNSHVGAPVAGRDHPVVFFHHGLCGSRTDSTIVAEDLASRGYVVVALGNTGESAGVAFPDGTVVGPTDPAYCRAGADPFSAQGSKVLEKLLAVRVADVEFVADELQSIRSGQDPDVEGAPLPAGLAQGMDLTAMGIYGHSFGGATAAAVAATDKRFVAGVDLDGFAIGPTATKGVGKPFLVVGVQRHDKALDASWKTFLPALAAGKAWHRWFSVQDSGHYRFIDLGGSIRRWGLDRTLKKQDPTTWAEVFGNIDDATSQRINRALVGGFFDQFLRGTPSAVLTDPTSLPELSDRSDEMAG